MLVVYANPGMRQLSLANSSLCSQLVGSLTLVPGLDAMVHVRHAHHVFLLPWTASTSLETRLPT